MRMAQRKSGAVSAAFRDPGRIRTSNQQNRNLSFYPIELRGRPLGAAAKVMPDLSPTFPVPATVASRSPRWYLSAMLGLQLPTDPRWAQLVRQDLPALLTDHAWCEQKAASNAISLIVRYPELGELVQELTRIAQEELAHFAQVVQHIHARGWTLGPERKDHYVNELALFLRKDGDRAERLVDRLLFSAMIEARSCERFKMLTEQVDDAELRTFYRELMESEAGHYATFIGFARTFGGRVDVDARWKQFLAYEAEVVQRYGNTPTMHG